jgi:hypothetical protein
VKEGLVSGDAISEKCVVELDALFQSMWRRAVGMGMGGDRPIVAVRATSKAVIAMADLLRNRTAN